MRNMLCTMAAVTLISISSSLAFAQDPSTAQPTNGAPNLPAYGSTAPQQQPVYGNRLYGSRAFGQPSLQQGMPGGGQPSASQHSS